MNKHTPGPWMYIPDDGLQCAALTAKTGWICDFASDPSAANALLIAAAPDLLAELQNIANANTSDWDDPADFKAWAQNRARYTIRKATGEA
jgi:hypothetical protein